MQAMFHTLSEFGFRFCRLKQRDSAACLLQGRLSARICSPADVLRFRKNAGGATGGPRQQSEDICAAQGGKPADSATSFPFPFSRSEPGAGLHVRKIEHDPFVTQQKQQRVAGFVHEDVFAIREKFSPVAAIPESEFSFDLGHTAARNPRSGQNARRIPQDRCSGTSTAPGTAFPERPHPQAGHVRERPAADFRCRRPQKTGCRGFRPPAQAALPTLRRSELPDPDNPGFRTAFRARGNRGSKRAQCIIRRR